MINTPRRALTAVLVGLASLACPHPGWAQAQAPSSDSVLDQLAEGRGIQLGGFALMMKSDVGLAYSDNVYATETHPQSDWFLRATPSLTLQSLWGRHALGLSVSSQLDTYDKLSHEDTQQVSVTANGRLDVHSGLTVSGDGFYDDLVESRMSDTGRDASTTPLTVKPIQYTRQGGDISISQVLNRMKVELSANLTQLDYKNGTFIGGGISDQNLRDQLDETYSTRLYYAVSPDTNLFVDGAYYTWGYRLKPPFAPTNRNSKGYRINAGSNFKLGSHLMEGQVFAGYQHQNFDDPAYNPVDNFDYGIGVDWYVTPLTTISLKGASTINQSIVGNASSYVSRNFELDVSDSMTRKLTLAADLTYARNAFQGGGRTDKRYGAGLKADYELNRYIDLFARYDYLNQDSNTLANSFHVNLAAVGVTISG